MRQLFVPSTPDDEFTDWCARELDKFDTDVDGTEGLYVVCVSVAVTKKPLPLAFIMLHCKHFNV